MEFYPHSIEPVSPSHIAIFVNHMPFMPLGFP